MLVAMVIISGCNGEMTGNDEATNDAATNGETSGDQETAVEEPEVPRGNTAGNIVQGGFVASGEGWVYFTIPDRDEKRLFKMRPDGSEKQVVVEEDADQSGGIQYLNVIDGWIYYTSASDIVKIRTDGSERTVIEPLAGAMYLNVVGDWIYYSATRGIYKIRVDGEEKTELHEARTMEINVVGDWIYFINRDDDWRPYRVSTDGSKSDRVSSDEIIELHYYNGDLYFTTGTVTIGRVSADGGSSSDLGEHPVTSGFIIDDGYLYHLIRVDGSRHFSLLGMDLESGETEVIQELEMFDESERGTIISSFNIVDGWVYIHGKALDEDYEAVDEAIFRVQTGGSGLEKVFDLETGFEPESESETESKSEGAEG